MCSLVKSLAYTIKGGLSGTSRRKLFLDITMLDLTSSLVYLATSWAHLSMKCHWISCPVVPTALCVPLSSLVLYHDLHNIFKINNRILMLRSFNHHIHENESHILCCHQLVTHCLHKYSM